MSGPAAASAMLANGGALGGVTDNAARMQAERNRMIEEMRNDLKRAKEALEEG